MSERRAKQVCFFNTTRFWGGGEKWSLETALRLSARGHHVHVIAYPNAPFFQRAVAHGLDTTGVAISNRSGLYPTVFTKLKRFFKERSIETVIFNGPNDLKAGGLSARGAGVPQRVYQRGLPLPVKDHVLNRFLFSRVLTHIVVNSEATKAAVSKELSEVVLADKVRVIMLGVDLERFAVASTLATRERPSPVLGSVGRLSAEKNQIALVEVAALLQQRGYRFKLAIAGEGAVREELLAHAAALGVGDSVELQGFVEDIPQFLKGIDIFLLSSLWEGFGLALVEGGAAGKPAVAFDTTSTPEIIEHGVTGFLVDPGDVAGFAQRVAELMDDAGLRHRMGDAARRRVQGHFCSSRSIDELEDYLWGGTRA